MCDFCNKIRKTAQKSAPLTDTDKQNFIAQIGEYIDDTDADPRHFENLIDELLDTKLNERDRESEAIYQSRLNLEDE